jgi:flagellar export protein FliJ
MVKLRVDRIIEIKERMKEEKERALESARLLLIDIGKKITEIDSHIDERYSDLSARSFDGADFAVLRDYLVYLDITKAALLDRREKTRAVVEALRLEYIESAKEIRMLEKLKSRAIKEIRKVASRKDQKFLDDMALRATDREG